MWLNRKIIKRQAKSLISGRETRLFGVCAVSALPIFVIVLVLYFAMFGAVFAMVPEYEEMPAGGYEQYFNENFSDEDRAEHDFNSFGTAQPSDMPQYAPREYGEQQYSEQMNERELMKSLAVTGSVFLLALTGEIALIFMMPLQVRLPYYFTEVARGGYRGFKEGVRRVYRGSFKEKYDKKLGLALLKSILVSLLSQLFLIPGIIFSYSSAFAFFIACEYPELPVWDSIKLSRKMVRGYRTELFVLELSVLPWALASCLIFPMIFTVPYMHAVIALYYENFKRRALATGAVTEDDFLTEQQRFMKHMQKAQQNAQSPNGGFQPQPYPPFAPRPIDPQAYREYYFEPVMPQSAAAIDPLQNPYHQQAAAPQQAQWQQEDAPQQPPAEGVSQPVNFTAAQPQEPAEPEFTEPQEPSEELTEPQEPQEPADGDIK